MALTIFQMDNSNNGETYEVCDKCMGKGTDAKPMIYIGTSGRSRHDRNLVFLHRVCLDKALARIDKQGFTGSNAAEEKGK